MASEESTADTAHQANLLVEAEVCFPASNRNVFKI